MAARFAQLLSDTSTLVLGVGIVNIWTHPPAEAASAYQQARQDGATRLFLGFGIGHAPLLDPGSPGRDEKPIESMERYLDDLDSLPASIPGGERFLAALGPRMLRLSAARSRGAHPYLVTPQHTRMAREVMGPSSFLAPEQHAVLDGDPDRARALARKWMAVYLGLPNYIANFRRMGFDDGDFAGGGSDRMVDALVAWGDAGAVVERVEQHLDAGADHVAVQLLVPDRLTFPLEGWQALAAAFKRHGQL